MKLIEKSKTLVCSKHTHKMSLVFKTKKPINEIYLNFGPLMKIKVEMFCNFVDRKF